MNSSKGMRKPEIVTGMIVRGMGANSFRIIPLTDIPLTIPFRRAAGRAGEFFFGDGFRHGIVNEWG